MRIEGYAAVFNSLSEDLGGFREVILPRAFDRTLREGRDVRALVDHDPSRILGRKKAGTLELSVDSKGLLAKISPPDTTAGRDVTTSIKRGDIDGMSFAFRTITDTWKRGDELLRELIDVELIEVSVVASQPAYSATTVGLRSAALGVPLLPARSREVDARGLIVEARSLLARGLERVRGGVPNGINYQRLRLSLGDQPRSLPAETSTVCGCR